MKQKDVALIIMIIGISAIVSLGLSKFLIKIPDDRNQTAEVVEPITAEFELPDQRYFNAESYNPTQLIEIKDNNTKPFN